MAKTHSPQQEIVRLREERDGLLLLIDDLTRQVIALNSARTDAEEQQERVTLKIAGRLVLAPTTGVGAEKVVSPMTPISDILNNSRVLPKVRERSDDNGRDSKTPG